MTLHKALGELYHLKQGETESNDRFLERFKSCVNTAELAQGKSIFCVKSFADALDKDDMTLEEIATEEQRSKAVLLLECSDPKRYGDLSTRLQETTSLGRNDYPRTVSSMFEVMMKQKQQRNERNGASFTQQSANVIDPNWILLDTCSTDNVFCNSDLLSNIS